MKPAYMVLAALLLLLLPVPRAGAASPADEANFVRSFLDAHCVRCHGEQKPKADVVLNKLSIAPKELSELTVWKRVLEELESKQMPPRKEKQPSDTDRERVLAWIKDTLAANGSREDKLAALSSSRGNAVDHDSLFSGKPAGDPASPARVWRLSNKSYEAFMHRFSNEIRAPWVLPKQWDLADYSSAHRIGEAELEHHLRNCMKIMERIMPQVEKNQFAIRSLHPVYKAGKDATAEQIQAAVKESFEGILRLTPEPSEMQEFSKLLTNDLKKYEPRKAVERFLIALLFHPEVFYRFEEPVAGSQRSIMPPRQLARAIAFTLTDREPDEGLVQAVAKGKLATREDVRREVERILTATAPYGQEVNLTADQLAKIEALNRENWEKQAGMYHKKLEGEPFKAREAQVRYMRKAVNEKLKVFLTTEQAAGWSRLQQYGYRTLEGEQINLTALLRPRVMSFFQEYFGYTTASDVFKCDATRKELQVKNNSHEGWRANPFVQDTDQLIGWVLDSDKDVLRTLLTTRKTFVLTGEAYHYKRRGENQIHPGWGTLESCLETYEVLITPEEWRIGEEKLYEMPAGHRMGILMNPSWLVAQSGNFDNHAIHRGRWIHEKLLGRRIPDVPITVDAKLPDEPHNTLRERMRVTREESCWKCHHRMDPLGLTFEQFDHFGRYRTAEIVVDKEATEKAQSKNKSAPRVMTSKPFQTIGSIEDSGDPKLDGPVKDAFELIEKLSKSQRVEQVFVRHVFRYFLGRNETLADGPTLVAAHKVYRDSGGSFKALLVSLLSSEPFLYRTVPAKEKK